MGALGAVVEGDAMKIEDVEGIGSAYAEKLRGVGVATTDLLLERGARPRGRAELAEAADISPKLILEWVNHVDLMRLDGVGPEYADLLEAAGVDSPPELARRNAANLATTFQELDAARPDTVRRVPSEATVAGWIAQAKQLPRAVFHENAAAGEEPASGSGQPAAPAEPAPPAAPEAPALPDAPATPEPVATPAAATPAAAPSTPSAPRPSTPSAPRPIAAPPAQEGLWARIKRMIGLG
jgi:predicted flap endonuclease-1-like 5' DNA nuclease